ncbi:hypothetical protein T12_7165 [Trichinella patagoniensis]|uniref:Uncharacterized protein n=1 Tax=Trichinella patagoniensis TaxID=990121 RepID=A0A0V1A030_9BILA|nr:hypothetical protein T12_14506 [Trichinella patagoniensis]KRY17993.1 hypothetical protein T12_7165 [Trichinella patagoniensis]
MAQNASSVEVSNDLPEYSEYVVRALHQITSMTTVEREKSAEHVEAEIHQITSMTTVEREKSAEHVEADETRNSEVGDWTRQKKFDVKSEASKEELPLR